MESKDQLRIQSALASWRRGLEPLAIEVMTPDASLRRYFRIRLPQTANVQCPASVVCMIFDSTKNPEHSGSCDVPADDAYVALTRMYRENRVQVPELYFDGREEGILLIEDIGDTHLKDLAFDEQSTESVLEPLYRAAIDTILRIQNILPEDAAEESSFAFDRGFASQQFIHEMQEFTEFYLAGRSADATLHAADILFPQLADQLSQFRRTLVHRDFHSWNLLVDAQSDIRVIDFQDSLMASRCYDVVGLLNDRDTDSALGVELYGSLLSYFFSKYDDDLRLEYYLGLLQRDLKVSGRFAKLSAVRGLRQYEQWIPGTVRRIGTTLDHLLKGEDLWVIANKDLKKALANFSQALRDDALVP